MGCIVLVRCVLVLWFGWGGVVSVCRLKQCFAGVSGARVWLGLCHPRGLMCERGGVRGPFRVEDKAGSADL